MNLSMPAMARWRRDEEEKKMCTAWRKRTRLSLTIAGNFPAVNEKISPVKTGLKKRISKKGTWAGAFKTRRHRATSESWRTSTAGKNHVDGSEFLFYTGVTYKIGFGWDEGTAHQWELDGGRSAERGITITSAATTAALDPL